MKAQVVKVAWIIWAMGVLLVLTVGYARASSVSMSIPNCNTLTVTSTTGSTVVMNCTTSGPTPPTPPGPIPPSPPGVISCTGFNRTVVVDLTWATPTRQYSSMGVNDAVVVRFTTGSVSTTTSLPRIAGAEYNSAPSTRIARLSATPCDFSTQPAAGANIEGNSITAVFAIAPGSGFNYYPILQTNTTYYLNVKNAPDPTCAGTGVCDMFWDLIKPGGV